MKLANLVYPVFHPVVNVNGAPLYHEANMRAYGQRAADGHVRLLSVAEEMGFMDTIDCTIAAQALDSCSTGAAIGINVSAFTVQNAPDEFLAIVRRGRSMRCPIIIELTETVQPERMDLMELFLKEARRVGAQVAVDDYGTGHFEDRDVRAIAPDYVKLAMARVHSAMTDLLERAWWVKAIAMARACGADVIAEGIETAAMLRFVEQLGVRLYQGYHWGMPSHLIVRASGDARVEREGPTAPREHARYAASPLAS